VPGFRPIRLGEAGRRGEHSRLSYEAVAGFFHLLAGENFAEAAGVAVNPKGHVYVFHRGKHPLMEFDATGMFLRSIGDDLFVNAHMVRIDADDNIWTTDIGSHAVLKLSPEGRVLRYRRVIRMAGVGDHDPRIRRSGCPDSAITFGRNR